MTEEILFSDIPQQKKINASIAVQLHLYYVDLLDEFCEYFNNIPFNFDLYISCRENTDHTSIIKRASTIKNVKDIVVKDTQNKGRDIAPVYVLFREELEKHDYFLHVHSKKLMYRGNEQLSWRRGLLEGVLGSSDLIRKIFYLFENSKSKVGLFFPETIELPLMAHGWLRNEQLGKRLLEEFGYHFDEDLFNYPAGSFFWAKTDSLRPLFDRHFSYDDFQEEKGQTDGTLAHALERVVAYVCRGNGYTLAIGDRHDKMVRLGESNKIYRPYFNADIEDVCDELKRYHVVSFDIFDTLITRKIYEPDDIFMIMQEIIDKRYGIMCDFFAARKEAEKRANEKYGIKTSIDEIYEFLPQIIKVNSDVANEIKKIEIELEIEFAVPRKEVIKVYDELKRIGKRIILTSDMYIHTETIKRLLEKCGIDSGYEAVYVSCEVGRRKDDGSMWKYLKEQYEGANIIHVGDNLCSDIQLAGDVLKSTYYVMNPRTAFKMSDIYKTYEGAIQHRNLSSSLLLGKVINELLYNDPFSMRMNACPVIRVGYTAGAIMAGSIFTLFMQWLCINSKESDVLLFLSREGYALQKFYQAYYRGKGIKENKNIYFLTSRRAASVAALRCVDDMEMLFDQDFDGDYKTLLKERFGIECSDRLLAEKEVHLPEEKSEVKKELEPYFEKILEHAKEERKTYLNYINANLSENEIDSAVLIDLGYSGTIQYYLSKLLDTKVAGLYMCTGSNVRPLLLGCETESIYKFDYKNYQMSYLQKDSTLLEAILEAPYGQLISFSDNAEPLYKPFKEVGYEVVQMQQGICDFIEDFGRLEAVLGLDLLIDSKIALEILKVSSHKDIFAENVLSQLKVEDGYCLGGELHFSRCGGRYLIVDGKKLSVADHVVRMNDIANVNRPVRKNLQDNHYELYVFLRKCKGLLTGHGFKVVGEL